MEMVKNPMKLLVALQLALWLPGIQSAPIKFDLRTCDTGVLFRPIYCCPELPKGPAIDFQPKYDPSKPLRVRRALQCLSDEELATYTAKLEKAYAMMRAMPAEDPRSLYQHAAFHCAHTTNGLYYAGKSINIHFGWIFSPWHRFYLYFHERILQGLLDDPEFTIHFWNWENAGDDSNGAHGCSKPGNTFPAIYANPASSLYSPNRTIRAKMPGRIVDLTMALGSDESPLVPADYAVARNVEATRKALLVPTAREWHGWECRAGNDVVKSGGGAIEDFHVSVHEWIGDGEVGIPTTAGDPIFYAIHGNVERLWEEWRNLGGEDPTDSDFLDAEFVFFDENANLNRVIARDALDTKNFNYVYEKTSDLSWNYDAETRIRMPAHDQ